MGNRMLVGVLAALDALVAAAVGLTAALAPLTLLWVLGFGDAAPWAALWPAAARVWQLGHLVPVTVALPADYAVAAGVQADAATFTVSLAPLALTAFTAIFAARSGLRAARAGAPAAGAIAGTGVFAGVAVAVALTSANPVASVALWQAVLVPPAVFLVGAGLGAVIGAWRADGDDPIGRLRGRLGPVWEPVPAAALRGAAIALAGVLAAAAVTVAVLVVLRGGDVVALFQAGRIDHLGATVVTIGQLAYLPDLLVWAGAFLAGPGFALGAGTTVGPGAVSLPLVPGIPVLGLIPTTTTPWLLLVALLPVVLGALAGRRARRDLGAGVLPRLVAGVAMGLVSGLVAGAAAAAAAGSIGPGSLAVVGPDALAVGVALGVEVLVGALVALLAPSRHDSEDAADAEARPSDRERDLELLLARGVPGRAGAAETAPIG